MKREHDPGRKIRWLLVFVIHLSFLLCFSTLWAQGDGKGESRDILAIGTGLVADENVARAKAAAVADALNKGVEQYLVRTLGGQGMITHFPRLVRGIISTENREIENFTILAEERLGKYYKVLVRVRINERVMEERFRENGIVLGKVKPVSILFLVSEVEQPQNTLSYWWGTPEESMALTATELALHQAFEEFGFFPVNRVMKSVEGKFGPEMTAPDLTHEEAFRWGEIFSVPVVVQGRCEVINKREVRLSMVALGVDKTLIIDQVSQSETAPDGGDELKRVLELAARGAAARLCPSIRKAIESHESASSQIEVLVKGLRNYRDLKRVKEALEKEIEGVRSVKQAKVSGDSVGLIVDFSGPREEFLSMISGRENLPFLNDDSTSEEEAIILRMR
jgi:hypothetical protein